MLKEGGRQLSFKLKALVNSLVNSLPDDMEKAALASLSLFIG